MASRASQQDLVQPRRSPRTIEKLFGEIQMAELTKRQTRILLSLAQCTGWSADHIRLKMKEVSGKTIKPEDIWSFHWQWVMDRGTQVKGPEEIDVMLALLKEEGVTLSKIGRALYTREQPVSCSSLSLLLWYMCHSHFPHCPLYYLLIVPILCGSFTYCN
jgi:hypothetical protein